MGIVKREVLDSILDAAMREDRVEVMGKIDKMGLEHFPELCVYVSKELNRTEDLCKIAELYWYGA